MLSLSDQISDDKAECKRPDLNTGPDPAAGLKPCLAESHITGKHQEWGHATF